MHPVDTTAIATVIAKTVSMKFATIANVKRNKCINVEKSLWAKNDDVEVRSIRDPLRKRDKP